MHHIVRRSGKEEVSGFARLEMVQGRHDRSLVFEAQNLWMTPQRNNTGLTVALQSGKEAWFESEFGKDYLKDPIRRPNVLWWHKHPGDHPGAFSYQDKVAINSLCMLGGFVMSVVTSSRRKVLARLDYNLPISEAPLCVELKTDGHDPDLEIVEPDYMGFPWDPHDPQGITIRAQVDAVWDEYIRSTDDNPGEHELSEASLFDLSEMDDAGDPIKKRIKAAAERTLDKQLHTPTAHEQRYRPTSKNYKGGNGRDDTPRSTVAEHIRSAAQFMGFGYGVNADDGDEETVRVYDRRTNSPVTTCNVCENVLAGRDQRVRGICDSCRIGLLRSGME
jgi:hypothetical protein